MARPSRIQFPGVLYHIIARGMKSDGWPLSSTHRNPGRKPLPEHKVTQYIAVGKIIKRIEDKEKTYNSRSDPINYFLYRDDII